MTLARIFIVCFFAALLVVPVTASAQSLIKRPGAHTQYDVELEPHLAFVDPGFRGRGVGPGVRATFVVSDRAFVQKINNSVGIGVGADLPFGNHYCHSHGHDNHCRGDGDAYLLVPIVLQWNFWFTKEWSAFGEPGLALRLFDHDGLDIDPFIFAVGGRYQFNSDLGLTLRLGWPEITFGLSIFM
jgi:hypothetical protein